MEKYLVIVTKDKDIIIRQSLESSYEGSLRDMNRFINMSGISKEVKFKAIAESYEEAERRANSYVERRNDSISHAFKLLYRFIKTKFSMVL